MELLEFFVTIVTFWGFCCIVVIYCNNSNTLNFKQLNKK